MMRTILMTCVLALGLLLALPASAGDMVDLNTADEETLTMLDGVGPAKAAAIVEYRQAHGPFQSVEELTAVSGIGSATLDANRDRLHVGQ